MRKFISIFLISLFFQVGSVQIAQSAQKRINVLYVGNSLTTASGIPYMIADLAASADLQIEFKVYAPGGRRLMHHASDKQLLTLIKSQKWDYVVLQEQSQYPSFSDKQVARDVLVYATQLSKIIRGANQRTKIVFYQTMARKNGDPANSEYNKEVATYEGMQKRVNKTYKKMAQENRGILAPVGEVWQKVRKQKPKINLYMDNVHPNQNGAYLVACVLYKALTSNSPIGKFFPRTLDSGQAHYFQKVATEN